MSNIVLSASVRQNLLSVQSTADLLATTQERLSTGKKVNTALDNPTTFFTAQGLDNRASDISNLLDGINNGVQVLQAANTGITSLQKLIDSAKSIANQALQTTVGYSTKSNISTTIPGASPADLRGTTSYTYATATGNVVTDGTAGGTHAITAGTATLSNSSGTNAAIAAGVLTLTTGTGADLSVTGKADLLKALGLTTATGSGNVTVTKARLTTSATLGTLVSDGSTLNVDGKTVSFKNAVAPAAAPAGSSKIGSIVTDNSGNSVVYLQGGNIQDTLNAIDL